LLKKAPRTGLFQQPPSFSAAAAAAMPVAVPSPSPPARQTVTPAAVVTNSGNIHGNESQRTGTAMSLTEKVRKRRRVLTFGLATAVTESAGLWLRTRRLGGNVIVRCRQGHLYTTIWIPAASVKSLRLGLWRVQRCPVGHHWSLVTPVDEAKLSRSECRRAHAARDIRIP
jgi:hypothetical protein